MLGQKAPVRFGMIGFDELLRNNVKMTSPFGLLTKANGSRVNLRQFRMHHKRLQNVVSTSATHSTSRVPILCSRHIRRRLRSFT